MGEIKDLVDILKHFLTYFDTVYEYQQGLFIRGGVVRERKLRKINPDDLKRIEQNEKSITALMGPWRFLPFIRYLTNVKTELPDDYRLSFYTGLPLHQNRFSKILQPGMYFFFRLTDEITKASTQEQKLNLGGISVLTTDDPPVSLTVSCNMSYLLKDLYKAYIKVEDYDESLEYHTLSFLPKYCRGKQLKDWANQDIVDKVECDVYAEVSKRAEEWGLDILDLHITDSVPSQTIRISQDGDDRRATSSEQILHTVALQVLKNTE